MSEKSRRDRCVNPFRTSGEKGHIGKNLRTIPKSMSQLYPYLPKDCTVCFNCRKMCKPDLQAANNSIHDVPENSGNIEFTESSLEADTVDSFQDESKSQSVRNIELEELLAGLKEKFSNLVGNDPLKLKILTIAPESWSINKISKEFGASRRLAKKAKELRATQGILPDLTAKSGKTLSSTTIEKIVEFYESDLNSRVLPGMKDAISVIINAKRTQVQKRLLLLNLKELYKVFKELNPKISVGFSTFAKLRPKYCILAGASGTHSVCVCTIHQNCKLMLDAIDIKKLTEHLDKPICDYKNCLDLITCKNPSPNCHLNECNKCPSIIELSSKLLEILDDAYIANVLYSSWTATDRSTLQTVTLEATDFVNELCSKLETLKLHSFIAKQQSLFISEKKENLLEGEVIVMFDFSENYSYTVQDASQAFHFNNDQCTVFPVIYYYKEGSELKHTSCVFLSNSLKHDTAAVYTVQNLLIPEIKRNVKKIKKLIYMTDGAKQHFKNRYQIANLIHHKLDFDIEAEWHYSATAHGKSGYDGIGATFKREAYKASLMRKPTEAILSFEALFNWAKNYFKNIKIFCFDQVEHNKMRRKLNKRFESALPVPEILKNHSFQISQQQVMIIKRFSNATEGIKVFL